MVVGLKAREAIPRRSGVGQTRKRVCRLSGIYFALKNELRALKTDRVSRC